MPEEVRCVAAHEAGHIVVARALGIRGSKVCIHDSDEGVAGYAMTAPYEDMQAIWARRANSERSKLPFACRLIAMAGPEAEIARFGNKARDDGRDAGDVEAINFFLRLLPQRERSRVEKRLRSFAKQLVHRHRVAIALVAAALAEKLELSGAEIDEWLYRPVQAIDKLLADRGRRRHARGFAFEERAV